jgi:hypothetical protein
VSEIWGLGHLTALIGTIDPAMQQIRAALFLKL